MVSKEKLISQIKSFPAELSIDELVDRLVFIDKLENRIQKSEEGDTISEDELKNEISKVGAIPFNQIQDEQSNYA